MQLTLRKDRKYMENRKVCITTESSCDLSQEQLGQHGILTVPFGMNFPDKTVNDGEIPVLEIYDFYSRTKKIPTTNAVGPYQYTEFFERVAREHPGCEILHIGYSSACSCSFQNAVLGVKDCVEAKVRLVDSLNVSGGLGNLVLKASELAEENPQDTAEELAGKIETYVKKIRTSFVPNSLEFLLAGGRVSNAAAIGAAVLRLKPRIDIIDGELIAKKKYRGKMRHVAPVFVRDFVEGAEFDKEKAYVFYSEGADMEAVEILVDGLKEAGFREVAVGVLGCVMTIHGGKGAVGLSATEL